MIHLDEDTLIDYAHGALEPHEDADAFAHISACSPCAHAHADEVALIETLRFRAGAEEREFPESLRASILAATAKPATANFGESVRAAFANFRTRAIFGTAAGFAAVFAMFSFMPHSNVAPVGAPLISKVASGSVHVSAAAFIARHDAATSDLPLADHFSAPSIETASYTSDDADISSISAE